MWEILTIAGIEPDTSQYISITIRSHNHNTIKAKICFRLELIVDPFVERVSILVQN